MARSATATARSPLTRASSLLSGSTGALLILLLLVAVFSLLAPAFLSVNNVMNITRQYSVLLILAVGQTFVITTRGIDLSVAATAALSGSIMGVVYAHWGASTFVAIALGLLAGAIVGVINGLAVTKLHVPDIIVTLGTMTAVRGVALLVTGGQPVPYFADAIDGRRMPDLIATLGAGRIAGVPLILGVAVACVAIGWFLLNKTVFGRSVTAVGGNAEAARVSGIKVDNVKLRVYVLSGLFSAVGGMMLAGRLQSANANMGELMELDAIASVVIGGTNLFGGEGTVIGTFIGVFIIGALGNGLNMLDISPFWQRVVTGLVIIAVVALDQARRRLNRAERTVEVASDDDGDDPGGGGDDDPGGPPPTSPPSGARAGTGEP
ncbi:ABC transporter permease [Nitriliruptoraceae bacterium ZYF776]|nr:ABC transporter permease [Profundirhabdus halotolerans]